MHSAEMWKFLAGLGFFLYGMNQLEILLKTVSGRRLKLFLKKNTQNLFKAIVGGAIVTGIVQSSSVVSLIVLAFVESGIIQFQNALGVILGANLGTTLSSWIIASVGFKFNILNYSLPVIAVTTIGMFFFEKRKKLHHLLAVFLSLGLLFLGLGLMKESALQLVKDFNIQAFSHYNVFVFVLIGFVLTTIIQSSSATVAITLTAMFTGVLNLPAAAAVVIGSEVGTTIKIVLWGMKGSADKKRVAWGNLIYNIFTAGLALLFLNGFIYFIEHIMTIKDPLTALVFFQTSINILSIILFVPFLNVFSQWLKQSFVTEHANGHSYVGKNLPMLPMLAKETLKKEALNLFQKTLEFNKNMLDFQNTSSEGFYENIKSLARTNPDSEAEYARLKQTEGDILNYYIAIQEFNLSKEDAQPMLNYMNAIRQSIYSAKAIKDITHNLQDFNASANDTLHQTCAVISDEWNAFNHKLQQLLHSPESKEREIAASINEAITHEDMQNSLVISNLKTNQLSELEASTLMNVHHELLSCKKSLLSALQNIEIEPTNRTQG